MLLLQLKGESLTTALSQELGRSLKQEELDLLHYPRICGECGGGGANQVTPIYHQLDYRL
jgi:hypothetical protein